MGDIEANGVPIPQSPMSKEVIDLARRHTFYTNPNGDRFNLVALHRMNMHYLRGRLLDSAAGVFAKEAMTDADSKELTSLMSDYCTAVRDRELMRDLAARSWRTNPFHLKSDPDRPLETLLLSSLKARGIHPAPIISIKEDETLPSLPGGPWDMPSAIKATRERYAWAIVGGVVLIVPMVMMVLLEGRTANLVIASVSTVMFALAAAYSAPTKLPVELMGVTAAYAAVLVVFVGGTTGAGG
ncbi:hypothetical protein GE09DRAFT_1278640 [Coniochaeta sp. 2T2.1]|nr:hypothetical protein GE09DRAFT_1278640 [Coniochaeta sp. 2T2.1]